MRNVSAKILHAIDNDYLQIRLIEIITNSKTYYYSDSIEVYLRDQGVTYVPGVVISSDEVKDAGELNNNSMGIAFTALAIEMFDDLYINGHINAEVNISLVYVPENNLQAIADAPYGVFSGFVVDAREVAYPSEGTDKYFLDLQSIYGHLDTPALILSNSTSHQKYFPGDKGLDYSDQIPDEIIWGRKA